MPWTPSIVSYWKSIVVLASFLFVAYVIQITAHMEIKYIVIALAALLLAGYANRI